jgi:hypothetical protein
MPLPSVVELDESVGIGEQAGLTVVVVAVAVDLGLIVARDSAAAARWRSKSSA